MGNFLINTIKNVTLDSMIYFSQTCDVAEDVLGKLKGAASIFCLKTENNRDVLFQYASHELNLCLLKVSEVPQIFHMVKTMQVLGIFKSPKPRRKLEAPIAEIGNKKKF